MFCSYCGKQNEDGVNFCAGCGKSLNTPEVQNEQAPIIVNPVVHAIKQIASSPLFLAATVAFTVYIIFNIMCSGYNSAQIMSLFYTLNYELGMEIPYELYDMVANMGRGGIFSAITANITEIITAVGLWLIYCSGANKRTPFMKTGGLTIINVIQWINLIAISILVLLVTLIFVIGVLDNLYMGYFGDGIFIAVLCAVLIVIFAFVILYYAKIISSIKNIKKMIKTGVSAKPPSLYVMVVLVIAGVMNLISTITGTIVPVIMYGSFSFGLISGLNYLLLAGINIMFAVIIMRARKIIKSL